MPVITVSRECGSLGDEIGKEVADRLGLRYVDQEIIGEVAQRLGCPPEVVSERDEREGGVASELVRTMRLLYPATLTPASGEGKPELDDAAYLQVIRQVIWEVARTNNAVMVGRGSALVLPKHPDTLHVLIVAPLKVRVERVMASEGLDQQRALQRIKQVDGNRGRYIRHFYGANWLDLVHYDLVLDSGHFSQLRAASLICGAVARAHSPASQDAGQEAE